MTHINQNAKRIIIQVLCIILACAVVAGGIFGVVKLVEHFNSETKTLNLKFTQGALDSKGEYVETKGSLYTKEAFECQGLSITPAFDNNISYEVFFYDSTGEFLYSSGKQLKNYTFTSSETDIQSMLVSHARIVITPDDDDEIKWNEKSGYVKQLKVEVKRDQKGSAPVNFITDEFIDTEKGNSLFRVDESGTFTIESVPAEWLPNIIYKVEIKDENKLYLSCGSHFHATSSVNCYAWNETQPNKLTALTLCLNNVLSADSNYSVDLPEGTSILYVVVSSDCVDLFGVVD